jgi:hypothetical protein
MNTLSKLVYVSYFLESTYQFSTVNVIVTVENLRTFHIRLYRHFFISE